MTPTNSNLRALQPEDDLRRLNDNDSKTSDSQLARSKTEYAGSCANLAIDELGAAFVEPAIGAGIFLIRARNLDVYKLERIFRAIGLKFTRVYSQGMKVSDLESTVTFRISGLDRPLAESIAYLIENLNHAAVLIVEQRGMSIVKSK